MNAAWFLRRPCVPPHSLSSFALVARPLCRFQHSSTSARSPPLLTLAIESSCDDTCVAVLQKCRRTGSARLLFHDKITSDNRAFKGVYPPNAVLWHAEFLGSLIQRAMRKLPPATADEAAAPNAGKEHVWVDGCPRRKPDFVSVTRGPGMVANLATGLNTAKGLAAAWDVPLLGVNHMQAHALTPRLVSALAKGEKQQEQTQRTIEASTDTTVTKVSQDDKATPAFPFLSLLVSGGHTLLVRSHTLTDHQILAEAQNVAIGDMIDKCARAILPAADIEAVTDVMYGPLLERFAFPDAQPQYQAYDYGYEAPRKRADEIEIFDSGMGWTLTPPLAGRRDMYYDFSGFKGQVEALMGKRPDMDIAERRVLARHTMRIAFEHLASRLIFALQAEGSEARVKTVVVAGGVASNRYLMHVLRSILAARGFGHLEVNSPPPALCTDNAAMIAWTGMEMYEAGWRSAMGILALRKWPVDPRSDGGGILGAGGWVNIHDEKL